MTNTILPPEVHLSVALIRYEDRILLTWNARWGSFSLPMTKPRQWPAPGGHLDPDSESGVQAAVRAAAEAIGRPLLASEISAQPLPLELQPYDHRSQRDGRWKRYARQVYVFQLASDVVRYGTTPLYWIDPNQLDNLHPISPTAKEIINASIAHWAK